VRGRIGEAVRQMLIVFLRYPEPGKTKTRLIPELGADGAAALAAELASRALGVAETLAAEDGIAISIWYTGCDEVQAREIAPGSYLYHEQQGADLGSRMSFAFEKAFEDGYEQVALIGTDCPELDESIVDEAFEVLADADVALGPAADGGYYLIALRAPAPGLFINKPWGSAEVLEATVNSVEELGLSADALPMLWDVDRPEDLVDYELYKTRDALLP
jgi:rSAM/selenodomain-associated transferase 1